MALRAKVSLPLTPVFHDRSLAFEHEIPRDALDYWNLSRGERTMPRSGEIDPRGMKKFLSNVSLIEILKNRDGTVDYFVKLTGERVRQLYGPVAHRKLSAFLPADMEERWRAALDLVRTERQPLRVHGRMSYKDHIWLYQETLLAPLGDENGEPSMFLMATAWKPVHPA